MSRLRRVGTTVGLVTAAFAGAGSAAPKTAPAKPMAPPRFPFATGKVVYKVTSSLASGSSTLSWLEGGKKFRQDVKLVAGSGEQKTPLDFWAFFDGTNLYVHQPMMGKHVRKTPLTTASSSLGLGMPLISAGNVGKVTGKAAVLGRPCEIREVETRQGPLKLWTWKGLPLKAHVEPEGEGLPPVDVIATKLQTPATIAASQFKVPAGYQVIAPPRTARPASKSVVPVR